MKLIDIFSYLVMFISFLALAFHYWFWEVRLPKQRLKQLNEPIPDLENLKENEEYKGYRYFWDEIANLYVIEQSTLSFFGNQKNFSVVEIVPSSSLDKVRERIEWLTVNQ